MKRGKTTEEVLQVGFPGWEPQRWTGSGQFPRGPLKQRHRAGGREGSSEGRVPGLGQPPLRLGWPFRVVLSQRQEPGLCAPHPRVDQSF